MKAISNTSESIRKLIKEYIVKPGLTLVVVEATGGYESLLVDSMHAANIAVAIVNPRRVRDFAKGIALCANIGETTLRFFKVEGMVAAMRKLLTILNLLIKRNECWSEPLSS